MADNLKNLKIAVPFVKTSHPCIKDTIINHTIYNTNVYRTTYLTRDVRISNSIHEKLDQLVRQTPNPKHDIICFHDNKISSVSTTT